MDIKNAEMKEKYGALFVIEHSLSDIWNNNKGEGEKLDNHGEMEKLDCPADLDDNNPSGSGSSSSRRSKGKEKHRRRASQQKEKTGSSSDEDPIVILEQERAKRKKRKKKGKKKKKEKKESKAKEKRYKKSHDEDGLTDRDYLTERSEKSMKRVSWKGSDELIMMKEIECLSDIIGAMDGVGYTWDPVHHGSNITVLLEQPNVVVREPARQQTDGARGRFGYKDGRHVFQFVFNEKPWGSHCGIGLCTEFSNMSIKGYNLLFGRDQHSWIWDIPSGRIVHDRKILGWCPEDPSDVDHTISMVVNFEEDEVVYIVNGEEMPGFTGIKDTDTELYPCVTLVYGLSEVTITLVESSLPEPWLNDGNDDQVFLQDEVSNIDDEKVDINTEEKVDINTEEKVDIHTAAEVSDATVTGAIETNTEDVTDKDIVVEKDARERDDNVVVEKDKSESDDNLNTANTDNGTDQTEQITATDSSENAINSDEKEGCDKNDECLKTKSNNEESSSENGANSSDSTVTGDNSAEEPNQSVVNVTDEQEDSETQNDTETDLDGEILAGSADVVNGRDALYMDKMVLPPQQQILPIPSYESPKHKVKEHEVDTVAAAHYDSPPTSEISRQDTVTTTVYSDTEDEDLEYMHSTDLEEDDEYLLQVAHGWDYINRGGQVQPYPSVPQICIPMPNYEGKVQAIRCRQALSRGIHTWLIRELRFYSPYADRKSPGNNILIGIVSSEHRTFNYGYNPPAVGSEAWLWDPQTHLVWHRKDQEAYFPDEYGHIQLADDMKKQKFDLTVGFELTWNRKDHSLIYEYKGQQVAEIQNIHAKKVFPIIILNKRGVFPVEIKYIEGPKDHIVETLRAAKKLPSFQREDFHNVRPLTRQLSSKYSMDKLPTADDSIYGFGPHTEGVEVTGFLTSKNVLRQKVPPSNPRARNMAIGSRPLSGKGFRHKIDFVSTNQEHYVYGIVNEVFDRTALNSSISSPKKYAEFPGLGLNINSWMWDPAKTEIRHAGKCIGRYPPTTKGFEIQNYNRVRMVIDFSQTDYNTVSFTAINDDSHMSTDLGIAFVLIPSQVWPVVGISSRSTDTSLKMEYNSGPHALLTEIRKSTSRTCSVM